MHYNLQAIGWMGDAPCGMGMFVSAPFSTRFGSLFVLHNCGKQPAGLVFLAIRAGLAK